MNLNNFQYFDKVILIWEICYNERPQFIAHGLSHHFNVVKKVIELLDHIQDKSLTTHKTDLLVVSAMIHDFLRPTQIIYSNDYLENLKRKISKYFNKNDTKFIINIIASHNKISKVDSIYKVILYLSDKMDYSFRRGFLVQVYDKLIDKNKKNRSFHIDKILSELKMKKNSNLSDIDKINKQFTKIPQKYINDIHNQYELVDKQANTVIKIYIKNKTKFKIIFFKYLIREMIYEIKLTYNYNIKIGIDQLLYYHLALLRDSLGYPIYLVIRFFLKFIIINTHLWKFQ